MTDHEINKALALAIGWHPLQTQTRRGMFFVMFGGVWSVFSHTSSHTIWPIAERYNVFPYLIKVSGDAGKWNVLSGGKDCIADTAAKVVALAVIRMAKEGKK